MLKKKVRGDGESLRKEPKKKMEQGWNKGGGGG